MEEVLEYLTSVTVSSGLPTWKVKKILRFLYLYCSIAVCSKKKLVDAMLRPKKKKKKKKKRSRLFSKTVRFDLLPLSRVVKP